MPGYALGRGDAQLGNGTRLCPVRALRWRAGMPQPSFEPSYDGLSVGTSTVIGRAEIPNTFSKSARLGPA